MRLLESTLGPLLPEHFVELIAGFVLFLLILAVMAKVVVPMFEATYAKRVAAIEGGMDKAESAQREAQAALVKYQEQLSGARDEASRIREDAKAQAAQISAEIKAQAQADSERLLSQARATIEADREAAVQQLKGQVGVMATGLAGKIVGESLSDDERAQRTVDRFLEELERV